jgi:MATE family, multidrug efflux pump
MTDIATPPPPAGGGEPTPPRKSRYDRSIVEGPLRAAVWKIAWPTMVVNIISGLPGIVDHLLVGNLVGSQANAAMAVSWQIILIVIVFISSLFSGMGVLVARFAGRGESDKVDRVVYQAFLTAVFLSLGVMAPIGYFGSPWLLDFVKAAPAVQVEALPFIRIMFVFSFGMMLFFMLSGALRAAGDARTPMWLGIAWTLLNLVLNLALITGAGPLPAFGTRGSAMGTCLSAGLLAIFAIWKLWTGAWVVRFPRGHGFGPDWEIIKSLFRFGLPTGLQGIFMNIGGVVMLSLMGSLGRTEGAAAQAAFGVGYTELFSLITWTSVGLMGAAAAVAGQNLGAGHADRSKEAVHIAARYGLSVAAIVGLFFLFLPRQLLGMFGMTDATALDIGAQLLRVLSVSGLFITTALAYTGGLQGTGDTKSPLYISIISQIVVPLGICFYIKETGTLEAIDIWLAIFAGHVTRCTLSVLRFNQGNWRHIAVSIGDSPSH